MSEITPFNGKTVVLVDGDCNFCRRAVAWLRPLISAEIYFYAYQTADLVTHGISIEECEKSVQLIKGNCFMLIALEFSIEKNYKKTFEYIKYIFFKCPIYFLSVRFFVILRNLIF